MDIFAISFTKYCIGGNKVVPPGVLVGPPSSQKTPEKNLVLIHEKSTFLKHPISKPLRANVGHHESELCTQGFENLLNFRLTFGFFHRGLFFQKSRPKIGQISI